MPSPLTFESLQPTFRLLGDATGKQMSLETLNNWVEYFASQNLMAEAVNRAASDIAASWEGFGWPSAEYVAKRARGRQRGIMDELHGIPNREDVLEEWCELEGQRRWDSRKAMAKEWGEKNPSQLRLLVQGIDGDIKILVDSGAHQWLKESQTYRTHFRKGAAVGACIRKAGEEERKLAKQLRITQLAAAAKAMREDAEALLTSAA